MEQTGLFDTLIARPKVLSGFKPDEFPAIASAGIKLIALDEETTGKNKWKDLPVGTAISLPDGRDFYLGCRHQGGGNHSLQAYHEWKRRELRDLTIVNLNTAFDSEVNRNDHVDLEAQGCRVIDVAHNAALLDEHRFGGFNLNALGKEYVGRGKVECPVAPKDIHRVHAGEVAPYAKGDSRLAMDVYLKQKPLLAADDLDYVAELESDLIWVTNEMERNGAPIDLDKLGGWRKQIAQEIEDGMLDLYRQTGLRVNPSSPQDMLRMFKQIGLPYVDSQADTLKRVAHPAVQKALWVKQRQSLHSKYIDKYWSLAKDTGILRYALHQLRSQENELTGERGTITGRYSSSGGDGWGINCQQVMKPSKQRKKFGDAYLIRELFIAAKGEAGIVSSDAAQIEFRLFAEYARNPMMLAAYRADPWTDFYQFVVDMLKEVADYTIARDDSKVLNLATIYGQGRQKRMDGLGVDEETLEVIDAAYNRAFPQARRLMRKTTELAEKRGWVKTMLGRRGRFPDKDRYYRALNKIIQGTAADVNKLKLRRVYQERKRLGLRMSMTVHDELVAGMQDQGMLPEFEKVMQIQELPKCLVPILWDTGFGANWKEAGE
jgi:DNA polymerase-1